MLTVSEDKDGASLHNSRQICLPPIIKDSGSLRSAILSCKTLYVQVSPSPLHIALWEKELGESVQENVDTLDIAIVGIKSFLSDLGVCVFCQHL